MSKRKPKIQDSRGQAKISDFFSKHVKLAPSEVSCENEGGGISEDSLDSDCEVIPMTPVRSRGVKHKVPDSSPDMIPPSPQRKVYVLGKRKRKRKKLLLNLIGSATLHRSALSERNAAIQLENNDSDEALLLSPKARMFQDVAIVKSSPNDVSSLSKCSLLEDEEIEKSVHTKSVNNVNSKTTNILKTMAKHVNPIIKLQLFKSKYTTIMQSDMSSTCDEKKKDKITIPQFHQKKVNSKSVDSILPGLVDRNSTEKLSPDNSLLLEVPETVHSEIQALPTREKKEKYNTSNVPLLTPVQRNPVSALMEPNCRITTSEHFDLPSSAVRSPEDSNSDVALLLPTPVHVNLENASHLSRSISRNGPQEHSELGRAMPAEDTAELPCCNRTSLVREVLETVAPDKINRHEPECSKIPILIQGKKGVKINCSRSQTSHRIVGELNSGDKIDVQPVLNSTVDSELQRTKLQSATEPICHGQSAVMPEGVEFTSSVPVSEAVKLSETIGSLTPPGKTTEPSKEVEGLSLLDKGEADLAFLEDWDLTEMSGITCPTAQELSLEVWQRCKVLDVAPDPTGQGMLLHVQAVDTRESTHCLIKGVWAESSVKAGDRVSLQAVRTPVSPCIAPWVVDNTGGLMVQYPDMLVSGTAVVGSLFCQRRGVLSDWFRGLDSGSKIMTIGSLVHELLQKVLEQQLYTTRAIQSAVGELLCSKEAIHMMFSCRMSMSETHNELSAFVPHIKRFVDTYVCGDGRKAAAGNWHGNISAVQDIEESIWTPRLGIKGKVDVTVQVNVRQHKKVMPLELKTGRSSFSAEHRGQVILYTMMMADMGRDVDSGLLLYLRDGSMQEVRVGHPERRDLVLLRNQLAHYLALPSASSEEPPCLPEPINHHSACQKCPYLTLCSTYLIRDGIERLPSQHPLVSLARSTTSHLSECHVDYLVRWGMLLRLEEAERVASSTLKDLWSMAPKHREKRGRSLAGLAVRDPVVALPGAGFTHVLHRKDSLHDLSSSGLSVGEMILVSTSSRPAVASGTVLDINSSSITLQLGKDVSVCTSGAPLHIDPYESQGMLSHLLTSLGCLMDDTDAAARLRRLVVDSELPTFEKQGSSVLQDGGAVLRALNPSQLRAVLQALSAQDYLLIKGMAGTGKTATIAALVQLLVQQGKTVLVTSHTHSAVDNVLLKLVDCNVDFLRLGSTACLHKRLHNWGEPALIRECTSPELLEAAYQSKSVVATTCLSANHILFTRRTFDMCIMDESTQVLQPAALLPLFHATKFVLVGDPEQLPPVVRSKKASRLGLSESLFVHLNRPEAVVCLDLQYRMNQPIMNLANRLAYNGQLRCGSSAVAEATLKLPFRNNMDKLEDWLVCALSDHLEDSVLFLDTGPAPLAKDTKICSNPCEAAVVVHLLEAFKQAGLESDCVGIIAPYRAQVALLRKLTTGVEVSTVDQYQGRDKDLVVFSCTKNFSGDTVEVQETEILNDKRRLTVAITRAKYKLVVVGDVATLKYYSPFHQLLECLGKDKVISLTDDCSDFHWEVLMGKIQHSVEK